MSATGPRAFTLAPLSGASKASGRFSLSKRPMSRTQIFRSDDDPPGSNHAMERTPKVFASRLADRRDNLLFMTSTLNSGAQLALNAFTPVHLLLAWRPASLSAGFP